MSISGNRPPSESDSQRSSPKVNETVSNYHGRWSDERKAKGFQTRVLSKIAELNNEALKQNGRSHDPTPIPIHPDGHAEQSSHRREQQRTAMSEREMYMALLQPCVLHILRAAGFHAARPAALDSLVDLTARFLELVALRAKEAAESNHNGPIPNIVDVRCALQSTSILKPEIHPMEEQLYGDDDMRGVSSFISWAEGAQAREIRRVAGLEQDDMSLNVDGEVREDYLTILMKKHSKTGNEERFRGTMLSGDLPPRPIIIEGPGPKSIAAFKAKLMGIELPEDQEDAQSG